MKTKTLGASQVNINYGNSIENSIVKIQPLIEKNLELTDHFSSRYLAIKLLENDKTTLKYIQGFAKPKCYCSTGKSGNP